MVASGFGGGILFGGGLLLWFDRKMEEWILRTFGRGSKLSDEEGDDGSRGIGGAKEVICGPTDCAVREADRGPRFGGPDRVGWFIKGIDVGARLRVGPGVGP